MRALVALVVAGCAYQPGSFRYMTEHFDGQITTIDCLDIAVDRQPDLVSGAAVVRYMFGNRCDHPAIVDLASAAVVGRTTDEQQLALAAYDPRHELAVLRIDGRAFGREAIAYPAQTPLGVICVDAASIAHAGTVQWLCVPPRIHPKEVP